MIAKLILLLCVAAPAFGKPILDNLAYPERELNQTEKDLVWHCYRYHQFGIIAYEPCRYLTFDRPASYPHDSPDERIYNMHRYWIHLQNETYKQLAYLAGQNVQESYVLDCMLREKGRNGGLCQFLYQDHLDLKSLDEYTPESQLELKSMHTIYQDEVQRSRVEDCFKHHRNDKFIECYMVSWDLDSEKYGRFTPVQFKPVFEDLRKIWNDLEKKEDQQKSTGKFDKDWFDVEREFDGVF